MKGEIIIAIENLNLKELKAIIIAVENHHYSISPAIGPQGRYEIVLKPAGVAKGVYGDCNMVTMPNEAAASPHAGCGIMKQIN